MGGGNEEISCCGGEDRRLISSKFVHEIYWRGFLHSSQPSIGSSKTS